MDDLDAITPCPPRETQQQPVQKPRPGFEMLQPFSNSTTSDSARTSRSASPAVEDEATTPYNNTSSSTTTDAENAAESDECRYKRRRRSVEVLEHGTDGDPARLWERMLALQQAYGCYKSARMSAALSSGDASLLLPSKACLDLMNEHMSALPDDVDLALEQRWQANA
ncbi:uncharacterized protein B0I36DRAFT_353952 [Microdochium trichocladiopsis]|uniref:Uncharacterized protein n=1 Tax=Microdochium trichocladiopsis TaxID=1682393 RepID=A0A9P8XWL3_9PEZI|nr:uncharacterized protein B0I36DRAFT_353952 [Microdochium trichocladiopsis]KAH7021277.1 hypothetical protein B0I36DRAFT_353952 [Microdochium trichocladiopsis]